MPHARVAPPHAPRSTRRGGGRGGAANVPTRTAIRADAPRSHRPTRTADCPTSRNGASCPGKRQCAPFVLVGEGTTPDRCALHPFCPGVLLPIGCSTPHRALCPSSAHCPPSGALLSGCSASHRARCPLSGSPLPIRCTTPVHPAETTSRGSGDRARHTPWLA